MSNSSVEITAGLGGFLVVFALAMAVWFLGRDLTRRLRRMRLAEDKRLAQEAAQRRDRSASQAQGTSDDEADPIG